VKENALLIAHIGIDWMGASPFLWRILEDSDFSTHYIEEVMEPTAPLFVAAKRRNLIPIKNKNSTSQDCDQSRVLLICLAFHGPKCFGLTVSRPAILVSNNLAL